MSAVWMPYQTERDGWLGPWTDINIINIKERRIKFAERCFSSFFLSVVAILVSFECFRENPFLFVESSLVCFKDKRGNVQFTWCQAVGRTISCSYLGGHLLFTSFALTRYRKLPSKIVCFGWILVNGRGWVSHFRCRKVS